MTEKLRRHNTPDIIGHQNLLFRAVPNDFSISRHPFDAFSAHSPTFPSRHLRHISFSNSSVALPMSQLILQSFRCITYVTAHSPTHLSLLLRHRFFTYVTWRAAHEPFTSKGRYDNVRCVSEIRLYTWLHRMIYLLYRPTIQRQFFKLQQ